VLRATSRLEIVSNKTSPAMKRPVVRPLVLAAILGATLVAWQAGPSQAQSTGLTVTQLVPPAVQTAPPRPKRETIDARLVRLHADLQITPAQQPLWEPVARTMRANAADMEKRVAARRVRGTQYPTALEDLKIDQEFAKAHLDGLVELTASFKTLYDAMPDAQKRVADKVFGNFNNQRGAART
jgi:hypothetical protein